MDMFVDNLILGAGISGLAYANEKCKNSNKKTVIFEAKPYYGGLCHSFNINGFTFDTAVHLSFTTDSEARKFFDKTKYKKHLPVFYNYYNGKWLKHPVINNMMGMDVNEKVECITSFVNRKKISTIDNYEKWLRASYGDVIAEKLYFKYTKKYWTVQPCELSTSWIGERLNTPDLKKMLLGSYSTNTGNDYYAKEMRYPIGNGGFQKFLEPLLDGVNIEYNKEVAEVDLNKKYVRFLDGTKCFFKNLISSIPLPVLVARIKNVPRDVMLKANNLKASKISLVSIGFNKKHIAKYLCFYIYDEDIKAARVYSPSLKSSENAPGGCSSLQFEIYHNPSDKIDPEEIVSNVKLSLLKMKVCKEEDILFMDYRIVDYGNVIFLNNMERDRYYVKEYLTNKGVQLIGRFGQWDYLWSDQSYLSGIIAAKSSK